MSEKPREIEGILSIGLNDEVIITNEVGQPISVKEWLAGWAADYKRAILKIIIPTKEK